MQSNQIQPIQYIHGHCLWWHHHHCWTKNHCRWSHLHHRPPQRSRSWEFGRDPQGVCWCECLGSWRGPPSPTLCSVPTWRSHLQMFASGWSQRRGGSEANRLRSIPSDALGEVLEQTWYVPWFTTQAFITGCSLLSGFQSSSPTSKSSANLRQKPEWQ